MALELKPSIDENTRRRIAIRELLDRGTRPNAGVLRDALLKHYSITVTGVVVKYDLQAIARDNERLEAWRNASASSRRVARKRGQTAKRGGKRGR